MSRVEVIRTERRRRFTKAEREAVVADLARPDLTTADVARQHGLSRSLVQLWKKKAGLVVGRSRRGPHPIAASADFVRLIPQRATGGSIRISLTEGIVIEVDGGIQPEALADLIRALRI